VTTIDRIVDLLRNENPDTVAAAVAEMDNNVLTTFITLVIKEEQKAADKKTGDIVIDDTQCKS
jgi:predicted Zn-ribbon and HTH transcriptional regulator